VTDSGQRLRRIAGRLGRHQTRRLLAAAAARGAGISLLLLAALLAFDRVTPAAGAPGAFVPLLVRAIGFVIAALLPVVLVARAVVRCLPAWRDLEEAARRTEGQAEGLRERLVPALQVLRIRDDGRTGYSTDLVDAFVDDTLRRVDDVRPSALPYNVSVRRALRWTAGGVASVAAAVVWLGPAGTGEGLLRLATAPGHLGPQPRALFVVEPGNVSVPRGQDLRVAARVDFVRRGRDGAHARLQWRTDDQAEWRDVDLDGTDATATAEGGADRVPSARFEHLFSPVKESFAYRFAHAGELSGTYRVEAVPRPSLTIESVRYRYPEYTGLPDRVVQDGSGDLAAVRGSVAEIRVRSTNEPRTGRVELGDGETRDLAIDGDRHLVAELPIDEEGSYRLHVEDTLGLTNPNPLEYRIRALADEAPFIRLLEPGQDTDLDESMKVALRYSAVDDYGLGPVRLVWEVSRREGESRSREIWQPRGTQAEAGGRFEWDLSDLDLLPGDTVAYHLEVRDNNVLDGPRTARTRDYVLRFPTMSEIYARIDEKQESSIDDVKDVLDEARKVQERVEDLSREMLKQGDSSWENQQEMQRALEQQQKLAGELERAREQIEQNLQQLSESEFATLEAMQKMEQIRKLLDEVASTEMKEALEKLQKALEEANPRRRQDELADFKDSQEELMQQLDRIMENLKQFQLEEKMRAAVREMEELAARQEAVNDELAQLSDPEKDQASETAPETSPDEKSDDAGKANEEAAPPDGEKPPETSAGDSPEDGKQDTDELADSGEETSPESADESKSPESGPDAEKEKADEMAQKDDAGKPAPSTPPDEAADEKERKMKSLAQQEEKLAEEARRLEETLKDLAKMTQELRDSQDSQGMQELSDKMGASELPEGMQQMSEDMQQGQQDDAQEQGEKALTQLRDLLAGMRMQQQGMAMRMIQISQAAINRAVRDLLSLSTDEESLASDLSDIPRNSASATRSFADEQYLLIQGAERVEAMLREVAKDTPLLESSIGRNLDGGVESMRDAAFGLENGVVHLAREDGEKVVDQLNAVVIALLQAQQSMSSCPSGMPMSGMMQQLQELSGDQQKLNEALKQLMEQGGKSMDHRLQAQLDGLAAEQRRIQEQLKQLLDEMGSAQGMLGRLDDVEKKLDETADRLESGDVDEGVLRDQAWALTRLLDSQRSMRERDLGKERKSETAEELSDVLPPGALPEGLDTPDRDLREDLLKALDRRYPPKYEELIRRYFRSLSDEVPPPDLP